MSDRKDKIMAFTSEAEFEKELVRLLPSKGWEPVILKNCTEEQLIQNWANILFENNRSIDRLNDYPLTKGEMQQILEQIANLRTPLMLNGFINGGSVMIKRDNPDDTLHFGKEVSLKIYDRREIAAGQSRYQIVEQPKFNTKSPMLNNRRGDVMLLINGMPVIHIELKKSGIPVSQAYNQIEKYAHEGVFTGLFSLVQIFVAMNPEETVYFANPGPDGKFNPDFYFHWADFNNEPINDWQKIAFTLLSIPMAHQLIGFYTVADDLDGTLKVMRSYQYFAASAISDKVAKTKWEGNEQLGGYIWHTTGSGKTMTSFKSAQLIAASNDADKVVFLMDRIELGTQSLRQYRGFADDADSVQSTENTGVLVSKLKSNNSNEILIVTSIQKMSNIKDEAEGGMTSADIKLMQSKRIVFIIDECHRNTFGDMLYTIKQTFPKAVFFGFTGTPIHEENQKKKTTTAMIFGNELHRYSIADGIRDKNVLGFDPYKVLTFKDQDVRVQIALAAAKAKTVEEAYANENKRKTFKEYLKLPMAGRIENGDYIKGIEDYLPDSQYETEEHQNCVVKDIIDNWVYLSHNSKFHAIFATSSIHEAIQYYRLFKKAGANLKITALFDPSIDNNGGAVYKEDGLVEIISDYNKLYNQKFTIPTFAAMKKDIASRLAHKRPYAHIANKPEEQIDLLIVVDQMLTGFDSKWINTLYMDKMLKYENIIQAFSRTNRIFGPEKPFGTIKYYRRPHTMEKRVAAAFKLYSGDKPLGLFVNKLDVNLENLNFHFKRIKDVFEQAGVPDFAKLPEQTAERAEFARLFKLLNESLEAAKLQGFNWQQLEYKFAKEDTGKKYTVKVELDEKTYKILLRRYKELSRDPGTGGIIEVPYDIDGYLTTIDTDDIDSDYMNSRFVKYIKLLHTEGTSAEVLTKAADELHKTFATLTQEEQKFANILLHDIQRGDVVAEEGKTFRDYITEYLSKAKNTQVHQLAQVLGVDEDKLQKLMSLGLTDSNINAFGRFDALKATADKQKAKAYFERLEGKKIILPKVNNKIDLFLRKFILEGGFDIEQ